MKEKTGKIHKKIYQLQWAPLNGITDIVINW
jgi:hypothetical protein